VNGQGTDPFRRCLSTASSLTAALRRDAQPARRKTR
jgi:hypothetical protein